ncbi:filamentous hemagglutinin N-terminal domain-containing protein [uncultured Mitsuokella sp.]|uniref:two-partner secretion domain-containing protein n=1 Tax=uncultured Mitsuokella sp. TaxID=453120 RepID=UPI00260F0BD9|nr:filamentous hemagglutinin N-terminal domain-containing protein [uncultured Mitsuokella sp.]
MTRKIRRTWHRKTAALAATMMAMSFGGMAYAMPQGETIRSGHGEITRQDKEMTVNQDTKHLAIDWKGFDINNDERVRFNQPDAASIALNRVTGDAKTFIDGSLTANGQVFVINPNGVLFGQNASVDVGSLVASTARVSDSQMEAFGNGDGTLNLELADDSTAKVINEGTIRAEGGLVALHAAAVENSGTIANEGGKIALAAAKNINLSADTAGKLNFTVDGTLAKASTLNSGVLKADGGYIVMTAKQAGDVMSTVVNNTGTIEAKTLHQNEKGEILLDGGDTGIVEVDGTINASGVEAGQSAGSIKAIGAETHVKDGANLLAKGNVDGGLIETSGDYLEISDKANIDAAGETGKAGEWLLDPTNVVINDTGSSEVQSENNQYTNGTTYIKTSSIVNVLKRNNVKIQAIDRDYGNADITLDSALNVDQTTTGRNTLTLESQGDVNINADINATSPLNVVLNADSDDNDKGGVNINADIITGGGSLTTGANGATFFGSTQEGEANRVIETAGGAVNIQNEARLQLNGGTLSINTSGGHVTFAKNVASMNKYEAFMDHDFVSYYKRETTTKTEQAQAWEKMLQSIYGKKYTDSDGTTRTFAIARRYYGYGWQIVANYSDLTFAEKVQLSDALAQTWELAKLAATQGNSVSDPDGKQLNGKHLVTITDKYENSAAMANAVKKNGAVLEYFTGGKETTNMSASRTSGRQFAWVTGPEKGTTFYISSGIGQGSDQNGMYTNWVQGGNGYSEPNNNNGLTKQPYVAIGWTDENGWDDVHNGASTIHGFIRETELPNSALSINSGAGDVTVGTKRTANTGKLGSGVGTGLRNVSIKTTTGDVKVLDSIYVHDNNTNAASDLANGNVKITTQGNVDVGKITADKKVEISSTGAEKHVNVNGKITTDGLVSIESADDITVHGIQNADKIRLVSTDANGNGAITLANNPDGNGALVTSSTANDAVIIDARGANGSFHNATDATKAKKAITTGTNGNWKVYSASPDRDTFGTNLNSDTTARWHASSQGGNGLDAYAETEDTNKYIFQVQPTVTVKADNQTKVYGDTADVTKYTTKATASFTGRDDIKYSVLDDRFKSAFQEGDLKTRYTGEIALSSEGAAKEKTRMDGDIDRTSSDNARPYFVINAEGENLAGKEGYAVTTADGTLEIFRRNANISGTGTQTYGNPDISWTTTASNLKNNDQVGTVTIKEGSAYTENQKGRTTADFGTYENSVAFGNILNEKGEDASINYNLTGTGTIQVNKAKLSINTEDKNTTYGVVDKDYKSTIHGLTNGDDESLVNLTYGTTGYLSDKKTNNVGDYDILTSANALQNYDVTANTAKLHIGKAAITIHTDDVMTEYGTVKETTSEVEGLTNGDLPAGFIFDYGDYGGAYLDGNTKTNNVNTYHFGTEIKTMGDDGLVTPDFLSNYTITGGDAEAVIMPKDVTFVVTGTGKTTSDVTYTENPLVDSQLVYGEHANTVYALDQDLGNNQYSILTYIDRQKVTTGDVIGNYRFNYEGLATITPDEPNPPTKPDIDHNNPSNIDGTASWTNSMGNHGVPGVDRVAGLASAELPFFKVQNGEVSHYGTYSVAADPDKVTLEATGKRLPEPNQPKTQYREYTKELTTAAGTGTFRMIYDGSTFRIKPVGMMAKNVIVSGDATQNVELYAKALHIGFNEMGILLEDLDGVYVHFDENE